MTQKALDLRRSVQIARHHKILVGLVVILGLAGGGAYAVLRPPMLSSTALIALLDGRAGPHQRDRSFHRDPRGGGEQRSGAPGRAA
jgi:hypothetical protein